MKNFIRDLFSPVLSDTTIMRYNQKRLLITTPMKPSQIQPNSVDLTLGGTFSKIIPNQNDIKNNGGIEEMRCIIDPKEPIQYERGAFDDYIVVDPHSFMLLASEEFIKLPNGIIGFVQGRSSVARMGIQIEQAGLIDAGFQGTVTFEIYNETDYPVKLYKGMRVAQIYFIKAQRSDRLYGRLGMGSKYQNQLIATGSMINNDPELQNRA